jgi:phosphopantothenate synthetase
MNVRKVHKIWIEQCDAAQTIKARFGLTVAFDYLVGEKLMSFASAASRHPDFARELPRFVSEVRRMFTPDEIGAQLAQIERAQNERNVDVLEEEEDDLLREGPAAVAECVQQFMLVKELLTAPMLGTS